MQYDVQTAFLNFHVNDWPISNVHNNNHNVTKTSDSSSVQCVTGYKELKHAHLGHSTIRHHVSYSLPHYKVTVNRKTLKLIARLFTLKRKTVKLERQTTLYVVIQQQNFTVNVAICPHCLAVSLGPALSLSSACGQSFPRFICAILWQRSLLQRLYTRAGLTGGGSR